MGLTVDDTNPALPRIRNIYTHTNTCVCVWRLVCVSFYIVSRYSFEAGSPKH